MVRVRDEAAYRQAMYEWVVPECLHVPIVAVDEAAITNHIGDIVDVISPGRAIVVKIDPPPERDDRLLIWQHPLCDVFFELLQVWVKPSYTKYRKAYIKAKGEEPVSGKVLAHVYNRRTAILRGYGYVRLVPVSRRANSSSGFTEQWGVELAKKDLGERRNKLRMNIQYADLGHLMVMLDMNLGGGVQEAFRLSQDLIEIPSLRPPQSGAR